MTILDSHIHRPPKDPHRLTAMDGTHLRCVDCQHTLDVANLARPATAAVGSTSKGIPRRTDPGACPLHSGFWAGSCGPCRSEQLALLDGASEPTPWQPTADVTTHAANIRRMLAGRRKPTGRTRA